MFEGRNLVIATKHEKQKVIAPILEKALGVNCFVANDLDTVRVIDLIKEWCSKTEAGSSGGSAGQLSRVLDDLLGLAI